jgi:SAM-dependent methyltransferase
MHIKFLEILRCPSTGSNLDMEIIEQDNNGMIKSGFLISQDMQKKYPIIDYIPRFVNKEYYSESFGYEWKKWSKVQFESANNGKEMAGHTIGMFRKITEFKTEDLKGKLVIDYGCGSGRFIDIVRKCEGITVGIDMSMSVNLARNIFKDDVDVLIVQGDILHPPFKKGVFDYGYTIGVLHHTSDPCSGFLELSGLIKKGGSIACCVYPKNGFYNFFSVNIYRKISNFITNHVNKKLSFWLAVGYAHFSAYILYYFFTTIRKIPYKGVRLSIFFQKYFFVYLFLPDAKWRVLDVFDAITPMFASTHTADEVEGWFKKAKASNIKKTRWCDTSFIGIL